MLGPILSHCHEFFVYTCGLLLQREKISIFRGEDNTAGGIQHTWPGGSQLSRGTDTERILNAGTVRGALKIQQAPNAKRIHFPVSRGTLDAIKLI